MKINKKIEQEIDVKYLHVKAGVRYWEDSMVNGVEDTESGDNIPCKVDGYWYPIINIDSGQIINWEIGKVAEIHYKVCDDGEYKLVDLDNDITMLYKDYYVPSCLCPKENGYGDYIIMDIDSNGFIKDWKFTEKDAKYFEVI